MAKRGSVKRLSVEHEDYIAERMQGKRSPSSGGADHDQGDVRTDANLIECKLTGAPGRPIVRKPTILTQMEKIADEAWSEARDPMLALRYFCPDSPLANSDGWVDLIVTVL